MKIATYNVNGIRAASTKGLLDWVATQQPDILCLQEVKALPEQADLPAFERMGYRVVWNAAEKKGYSGVAIFTKIPYLTHQLGIGDSFFDAEGRAICVQYPNFMLVNAYFPSGTTGDERQTLKYRWLTLFSDYIVALRKSGLPLVVVGDFNIAHTELDIHNPVRNKNVSGFQPAERDWFTNFLALGFVDTYRLVAADTQKYSWWSYRANARAKNLGWRIDYILVSVEFSTFLSSCEMLNTINHSDHCPVVATFSGYN